MYGLMILASSFKHWVKFEFESIFVVTPGTSELSEVQSPTDIVEDEALVIAGCVERTLNK